MAVYNYLMDVVRRRGAGYIVLIDPDRHTRKQIGELVESACEGDADAIFVGSSIVLNSGFDSLVRLIKRIASVPVILFPGSTMQISRHADAILFLSLVSGRDPNYLIGEQVKAAPVIRHLGVEPISTGYMLIESGKMTSAEFMSNTRPIPRDKFDIAKATALAAEFLGMKLIYLEAGSGATYPVKTEMVQEVCRYIQTPLIVGGGIRKPEEARARVEAGASFIVTGNILENRKNRSLISEFAQAVHVKV
ncbi:MAG: geranylgeranylglyceryl/heptaprenylglyceryl phosphate synthase [candidate division KSB1 bacterium]|nr:geranylgeranylglyceryl/heptaprenylglyceryl phosphate synthase [candidate division KSB1 bacterium]